MSNPVEVNVRPFLARRARLLEAIGDGVALIPTAAEQVRNQGNAYPYRADSSFYYLTGFPEPDAALVLTGGRSIFFCRERDAEKEIWHGHRYGPERAREAFAFDEAWPFEELSERLPSWLASAPALWFNLGQYSDWDLRVTVALNVLRTHGGADERPPGSLHDLRPLLNEMRLVKDADEQAIMRRAATMSSAGHQRAMRLCRPGIMEYELEAELFHAFRSQGASGHAYNPIVAGGANACVLHYSENSQPVPDGALVLIDAGCELEGYAADITRTFPVNGRFSAAQRDVYAIVLAAQAAAIAAIRPGVAYDAPHQAAVRVLTQGMIDLKLLTGSLDGLVESAAYKRFYMHNTGHWLGLDVHDVGEYREADGNWRRLQAGMTLTVEPGLYLRAADDVPEALRDIGIRIEDDVFVTETGCEVYTDAPKTIAAIEALMQA
ncbi:MAG: aminopeptidase P N-terminal domain-containing protein [Zoogloeaceae bacterium]|nr:aminopeptidase P N-terminal domain-containing protein [Zoogloeaceae bacterium]